MSNQLSESLTRALDAGVKALRESALSTQHEVEGKPDTEPTIRKIVEKSIEEQLQHADLIEGHLQRCGHRPRT